MEEKGGCDISGVVWMRNVFFVKVYVCFVVILVIIVFYDNLEV